MEKKVYIRGNEMHPERVVAELEKRGGKNTLDYSCTIPHYIWFNDTNNNITFTEDDSILYQVIATHPDWEEIFITPDFRFNPGDKVVYRGKTYIIGKQLNQQGMPCYSLIGHNGTCPESDLEPCTESILTWDDMKRQKAEVKGYYFGNGFPHVATCKYTADEVILFRSHKQAQSALAMAQISQLIEQPAYGGWYPYGEKAFILGLRSGEIAIWTSNYNGGILRFHTIEQATRFLEYNEQLVKDYLMLD